MIMRAPSVAAQHGMASHTAVSGGSTSASSRAQTVTLDSNPFASPEDDAEMVYLRASRPTKAISSDEDFPSDIMHSDRPSWTRCCASCLRAGSALSSAVREQ